MTDKLKLTIITKKPSLIYSANCTSCSQTYKIFNKLVVLELKILFYLYIIIIATSNKS